MTWEEPYNTLRINAKCDDCGEPVPHGQLFPVIETVDNHDGLVRHHPIEVCPACMRKRLGL